MTVAQASPATSVLLWTLVLIAAAIAGGAVVLLVRRRVMRSDAERRGHGLSLSDLRKMRDRGDLTDEEYERARAAIIGTVAGSGSGGSPMRPTTIPGEVRARPGFDLTGEPLPGVDAPQAKSDQEDTDDDGDARADRDAR